MPRYFENIFLHLLLSNYKVLPHISLTSLHVSEARRALMRYSRWATGHSEYLPRTYLCGLQIIASTRQALTCVGCRTAGHSEYPPGTYLCGLQVIVSNHQEHTCVGCRSLQVTAKDLLVRLSECLPRTYLYGLQVIASTRQGLTCVGCRSW